jgi:hypothetical protein
MAGGGVEGAGVAGGMAGGGIEIEGRAGFEGFGRVFGRFDGGTLGSKGCKAGRFLPVVVHRSLRPRHRIQVL